MKRLLSLLLVGMMFASACAIGAYPYPVFIDSPSGGLTIYLRGDQHFKFGVTEDGFPLLHRGDEWFFATLGGDGEAVPSAYRAEAAGGRSAGLRSFLASLPVKQVATTLQMQGRSRANVVRAIPAEKHRAEVRGERKVLVVLMQFADVKFVKSQTDFDHLFNQENYTADGAKGSVYDFYHYASYGAVDLRCDVIGPFEAQHEMAYYGGNVGWGGNDQNPFALFQEALQKAAGAVALSEYDTDGDGYIDNLHIIYAGYGEEAGASSDAIWAHEMTFEAKEVAGVKIDRYSCAPELRSNRGGGISRIGPHCHEIGHALGAMDYYDTDYTTDGNFSGTGRWDVMASGSWNDEGVSPANFNPYVKAYDYGWCRVEDIAEETDVEMLPSSGDNVVYRLNTPRSGEYFLLENRQQNLFDSAVPGHGLLLFHVGSDMGERLRTNKVNASFPQCCYVVCASSGYRATSSTPSSYGKVDDGGCPFPGTSARSAFDYYSTPAALCNDGSYAGFALSDIAEHEDGAVSFHVSFNTDVDEPDEPDATGEVVWQETFDGSFLGSFWSQERLEGSCDWTMKKSLGLGGSDGWLQLVPSFSPFDAQSSRVLVRLRSSELALESGEYVLSLKMACNNTGNAGTDSVQIRFYHGEELLDTPRYSFPVVSEVWREHAALVTESMLPVTFAIDGVAYRNTTLMIDDVTIRRKSNLQTVVQHPLNREAAGVIYTLQGLAVSPGKASLPRGVYIKDGRKVLVR